MNCKTDCCFTVASHIISLAIRASTNCNTHDSSAKHSACQFYLKCFGVICQKGRSRAKKLTPKQVLHYSCSGRITYSRSSVSFCLSLDVPCQKG